MNCDVVIRGGTVFDGMGSAPVIADVAIEGNRIIEVGRISGTGGEELDARGLYVTPGFIDIHSHSDFTLLVDPRAASSIFQGVTLEVIGNCGYGCAPIGDPILAGNNIYGLTDEIPLTWSSTAGYLERLESVTPAVNVLTLVPNGQLRLATIGMSERPATVEELGKMRNLLEAGIEEGAFGLSSGLEYPAEKTATEEELTELCRTVERAGGIYATHTRKRDSGSVEAVEEAIRTAENSGVRLQISHLLPRSDQDDCDRCVEVVDNALARGDDIAFDMHTRLYGTTYLSTVIPPWALQKDRDTLVRLLGDRQARERMKEYESILSAGGDWKRIVLLDNVHWPEYSRRNIDDIAKERGQPALDTVYDLLQSAVDDLHALQVIIHCYKPNQQQDIFSHQLCMPGSDATTLAPDGPLARSVFHGAYTWAAWFYRFMVKETGALSPEAAIHKLTGLPASTLNLVQRGKLEPGFQADIAIFDPETFCQQGTTFEPNQLATGMVCVLVNGSIALKNGELTESRNGEVLRFRN